jgi:hypothetical protein
VDAPWPALASDARWDWRGLDARVTVERDGAAPRCRWSVCARLPFDGLDDLTPEAAGRVPPAAGDRWRFNVFRIKRPGGPAAPETGVIYAAWSVPAGPSFHDPEVFRDLVFGGDEE